MWDWVDIDYDLSEECELSIWDKIIFIGYPIALIVLIILAIFK